MTGRELQRKHRTRKPRVAEVYLGSGQHPKEREEKGEKKVPHLPAACFFTRPLTRQSTRLLLHLDQGFHSPVQKEIFPLGGIPEL